MGEPERVRRDPGIQSEGSAFERELSMKRTSLLCAVLVSALFPQLMFGVDTKARASQLTATQIVEKNVAARGGLTAWRGVKALEMKGKLDAGGNDRSTLAVSVEQADSKAAPKRPKDQVQLPFLLDVQRGRKKRIEIEFNGQTAVQVYNGTEGWKLRPFLNRRQVENYTPDELKSASADPDLDGWLIDYAAKGSRVELAGIEKVADRDAYNLKVTDKNGHERHVWVDATTFLETKIEGSSRRLDGKYHPVATYLSDYRSVNGLMLPYLMETAVEGVKDRERIQVESIVSNPKLDDSRFAIPR